MRESVVFLPCFISTHLSSLLCLLASPLSPSSLFSPFSLLSIHSLPSFLPQYLLILFVPPSFSSNPPPLPPLFLSSIIFLSSGTIFLPVSVPSLVISFFFLFFQSFVFFTPSICLSVFHLFLPQFVYCFYSLANTLYSSMLS